MEEERDKLNNLIAFGADQEMILEQSQKLDMYIVAAMKGSGCNDFW